MTEAFFFQPGSALSVREIVALTGAEPQQGADLDRRITGIAALDRAAPSDLCFLDGPKFAAQASICQAGACLTTRRSAHLLPSRVGLLYAEAPYRAFVEVSRKLFPDALRPSSLFEAQGVAAGALVHPTARLEAGVTIDPGAVIAPRAEIGAASVIGAGAVVGPNVHIGRDCAIGPNVSIINALIGDRVIIHPGCRIGQDGFAYLMGTASGHLKVPQIGRVIIQDDVEIGANTTIDRGAMSDTVIGEGTKIDNLVQIAHNVTIGRHCILVSQAGISGSVVIEDGVLIAGQVGVADHITIGAGAVIAAQAGLIGDVSPGARVVGFPAKPMKQFFREVAVLERLARRGGADTKPTRSGEGS
ncbi:MAG TPA: UDP-3-O-(3-hydroxymyristoyl)glucosamine N-acyltransferase [Xanthobacteraceae bacterium]|jgi:UDP-3-O-[3-hydroxymyristoyl] glucosamine N-acyltransferase|nr:UDP-3-O-(3-hydroxymyristoyl)glucosamine N-acyltransferase [Xanthobacteraceae bacterium]